MRIPIYQIDAFTDVQFAGNPAAVCPLEHWVSADIMQKIAMENNLSETAFFVKKDDHYELRWFTPKNEVDLCGHATLATAYVIFTYLDKDTKNISFSTASGILEVTKQDNQLAMIFPSREGKKCEAPEALVKGLGKKPNETYKSTRTYMAVFETEEDVLNLNLDMSELRKLDGSGVIATAKGNKVDFVSRYFAPKQGVDEDPVTGSAHCVLVPYWKNVLNKNEFMALQISARGGKLYCVDQGETIKMSGEAAAYLEGHIIIRNL